MARNNARLGRLRRVLNEDQSSLGIRYNTHEPERIPGDTPRYGAGANIENHPQITDYVPRRMRIFALLVTAVATLGILAEVAAHYAASITAHIPQGADIDLAQVFSSRLIAWTSAAVLLMTAVCSHVIFLLKRHRIDDLGGRYRIWRIVSWFSVLLSANCVLAIHPVVGQILGHSTGWHFLKNDSGWWVLPMLLVGGYVFAKLVIDAAECRTALTMFLLAIASFLAAGVIAVGWTPTTDPLWLGTITRILPLAAVLFSLMGCLLTARYVVLDVQGLIEHDAQEPNPAVPVSSQSRASFHEVQDEAKEVSDPVWIDGSQPEDDYDRPLTKAERKRLRKQQRHRAA